MLCGNRNCQGSTAPTCSINVDKAWAILERDKDLGLERSRDGSITQFKSPPKIIRWEFRSGNKETSLLIKLTSSQLGAYTLTNTTGTLYNIPETITYLHLRICNRSRGSIECFCVSKWQKQKFCLF